MRVQIRSRRDWQTTENSSASARFSLTASGVIPEHWPSRGWSILTAADRRTLFTVKLSPAATDNGSVSVSRRTWMWWMVGTLATLPASAFLWFVGAMSAGGGEVYDPPAPGIVDPGIPGVWVTIALAPTWLALVGGFLAIRRKRDGLFVFSLTAPYVVAVLGVFAILAID